MTTLDNREREATEATKLADWELAYLPPANVVAKGAFAMFGDLYQDDRDEWFRVGMEEALREWGRPTKADIEAVSMRLADIAPEGDAFTRRAWCDEKAAHILAAVFGGDAE
jgi:hypothetical protein